jgi:hypothetical protein
VAFSDPLNQPGAQLTSTGATGLGSTSVTVTVNQTPPACGGGAIAGTPVLRHYNITPANPNGTATVRLYYDPASEANGAELSMLRMYHCDGTAWEILQGAYATGSDGASGLNYVELPGVTEFSPFALSTGVPTSIGLTNFTARALGGGHLGFALAALSVAGGALLAVARAHRKRQTDAG